MFYLIANWKANKAKQEAIDWLVELQSYVQNNPTEDLEIVVAAPFIWLDALSGLLDDTTRISLCSQYVSDCSIGSFTGEVPAPLLKTLVRYSLVGHSERRKKGETQEIVMRQYSQATEAGIIPLLCIRDDQDLVPSNAAFVAYEPISSIRVIGETTHVPPVESILQMKDKLHLDRQATFLYGGSIDAASIESLVSSNGIDGLLIGTASLDIREFLKLVQVTVQTRSLLVEG